jgi:hypothetical protein
VSAAVQLGEQSLEATSDWIASPRGIRFGAVSGRRPLVHTSCCTYHTCSPSVRPARQISQEGVRDRRELLEAIPETSLRLVHVNTFTVGQRTQCLKMHRKDQLPLVL